MSHALQNSLRSLKVRDHIVELGNGLGLLMHDDIGDGIVPATITAGVVVGVLGAGIAAASGGNPMAGFISAEIGGIGAVTVSMLGSVTACVAEVISEKPSTPHPWTCRLGTAFMLAAGVATGVSAYSYVEPRHTQTVVTPCPSTPPAP
jgi:hypothetical protein